jgi:DNA-binding NarL/FixJ family response regulator
VAVRGDLVGRRAELERLADAFGRAASGESRAIFVRGETGIGKTRLVEEALAAARARGFRVLASRAFPVDGSLGYALFLDALGPFLRAMEPARRAALVSGLPRLGRLFDGLGLPSPDLLPDAALEKTRLFEAVVRLVERLAEDAPLVLFFDDLHWADPSSLELLQYLVRGLRDRPAVVAGAYRSDEPEPTHALRRAIVALTRAGLAEEVELSRLTRGDLVALARGLLAADPPAELVDLLDQRTGGTPLFAEGVVRAMIDAGQLVPVGSGPDAGWVLSRASTSALPAGLRALILDRIDRLAAEERALLGLVAVYAEAAPRALLRLASGLPDERFGERVERLRLAGLLVEQVDEAGLAYALAHPLVQEVAYADLSETARRRGHAAFVAALESPLRAGRASAQDLLRLARHYRAAGAEVDGGRALDVLAAAADQARRLHSNEEAAGYYLAALRLARSAGDLARLPRLLEQLGEAWADMGENAAAIGAWTEVLDEHAGRLDAETVARVHRRLALAEWDRADFAAALRHLEVGVAALGQSAPSAELVELMHARLTVEMRLRDQAAATATAARIVALGRELGSPQAVAEGYLAEGIAHLAQGAYQRARVLSLTALAGAEAVGDVLLVKRVLDTLTRVALFLGETGLARQAAERSLATSRALGAPSTELHPRFHLVLLDVMAGDLHGAARASADALALARRLGRARALAGSLAGRAMALIALGELADAEALVAEARAVYGAGTAADHNIARSIDLADALLALERDEPERARAMAQELAQSLSVGANPPLGLAVFAEVQVAADDAAGAIATAAALAALGPPGSYPAALGLRAQGLARRRLGEAADAAELLAQAADAFDALGMPFEAARSRLELAHAAAKADAARAEAVARQSLAVFEEIGARSWGERSRHFLRALGVRSARPARRAPAGILSERQLEVARLVAEGLGNGEIAAALVVSPRTVTTHLDHIYRRLGITSRAALARYVVEAGLLPGRGPR